ncbi:AAA family ATPase [Streptomyces sp. NPDC093544]|uniref:AAA family ATPase n=1 Tax=Streptomyces sp. NPDC093544 TaxID=3155200 RepID=UPI00341AD623
MGAIKDKGRQLHQIERVPYEDAFLIGDLLSTRITTLAGEPKAGKTLFAAGMGIALINGEKEFLGQPVLRKLDHIVFGLTDDGAPEELKERLHGAVPADSVTVFPVEDPGHSDYWPGIVDDLIDMKPGLFVLDNIIGALAPGEDIASSVTAQRVMRNLKPISQAGIPVLLVTHTPKGPAEGMSVASSPIGGRAIAAGSRAVIALRNSEKYGRRVQTIINRATEDLNLRVAVRPTGDASEVPIWERVHTKPQRGPSIQTATPWQELLTEQIIKEQPEETSIAGLAHRYADGAGKAVSTIRAELTKRLVLTCEGWAAA